MNSKAMLLVLGRRLARRRSGRQRGTLARMPASSLSRRRALRCSRMVHVPPAPVRRLCRGRRWKRRSRCRRAGRVPGGRRATTGGSARRGAGRARRRPSGHAACGRRARACRSWSISDRWDLAHRLHRVGMEHHAGGVRHVGHFLDREEGAGFVVGPHHRDDGDLVDSSRRYSSRSRRPFLSTFR
jgi:hypothetical protein